MSWCSEVSLSSKCWGFCGFCPRLSSSLLDSYSEEYSPWSWAGGDIGSCGGAAFFAGAVGFGFDEDPNSASGALAKRPCSSLRSEMVTICA